MFALSKSRGSRHITDKANSFRYVEVINRTLGKEQIVNGNKKSVKPDLYQGIHMQMIHE